MSSFTLPLPLSLSTTTPFSTFLTNKLIAIALRKIINTSCFYEVNNDTCELGPLPLHLAEPGPIAAFILFKGIFYISIKGNLIMEKSTQTLLEDYVSI